jgi:hypothetical protein
MTENITLLWNEFQRAKLFAALKGHFNFDHDFMAYDAYVTGKADTLAQLTYERYHAVGHTENTAKFQKGERKLAARAYAEAQGSHSVKVEGPMNFVGIVGEAAEFSDERRSTVETPFGTEADNSEALS